MDKATTAGQALPVSILVTAQNEHGDQLYKLGFLLDNLSERLLSLRNITPGTDKAESPEPPYSPVVNQIHRQTDRVKNYQALVAQVLNELEI